ncbi:MAG: hercynine metabolism protein [Synechococcaceae cyanobacterium]|nr:hercynine metabolism protein [Synechococcaceae cyanobacterium]
MNGNWLEQLEARLERQLEAFLAANPEQERILAEQDLRERQERLLRERLRLRQEAELQRQALLDLATEIRRWQERVERARGAGAQDLVGRAERHVESLMESGRERWNRLGALGHRFQEVQEELERLTRQPPPAKGALDLEAAWAEFETSQDLQDLRRRLQL